MPDINISYKGVHKLLSELKIHKAAGPVSISPWLLREVAEIISPALVHIYQTSLDTGTVPTDWRTASIVPIFKKGDKSKASNYRPVSLIAICSKMHEHIIHSNVIWHITTKTWPLRDSRKYSAMDETIFYRPLTADTSRKHTLVNFCRWFRHTPKEQCRALTFSCVY